MDKTIVRIQGGLGNQMFQYVVYLWLKSKGYNALLDISHYDYTYSGLSDAIHNGYEIERIFDVRSDYATYKQACDLGDIQNDPLHRLKRKLFGVKSTHIKQATLALKSLYIPEIISQDNIYVDGYWGTFRYADDINEIVRKNFVFKQGLIGKNEYIKNQIMTHNSISIHVRHGDYMKQQNYYQIPSLNYYQKAIEYVKCKSQEAVFFCFSDDIDWCRKQFCDCDIEIFFIDWNKEEDSYIDMQLMSLCKHNIVANSTFSMWGAWLNNNKDKIVIRPQKVYCDQTNEKQDMWPEEWITVE